MESEIQTALPDETNSALPDRTVEEVSVDLASLEEVEREPMVDLEPFHMESNKILAARVVRIPSKFSKRADGKAHALRLEGTVVHTTERSDGTKIEFRPTGVIFLEEDKEGNLRGYPSGLRTLWQKLKRLLKIEKASEAVGKELPIKVEHNDTNGKDWLGYLF